jgi:LmbE family N-acetylglucosaminyl deacetylase
MFSPHPDDECIVGALPLRLRREAGWRVINVAVTLGSAKVRQAARLAELGGACEYLGFELLLAAPNGLERVHPASRDADPQHWRSMVSLIADMLRSQRPTVIVFPHKNDWNTTHMGVYWLVMDALALLGSSFSTALVETEYWGQMTAPNLLVEVSEDNLTDQITATSFHVGEVQRNPYHLLLPAWMQDNVRRGSELVAGQGSASPGYVFGTLYRLTRWTGSGVVEHMPRGRHLAQADSPLSLFD